ncbi:hypothetical protein [Clostridium sp. AM58-1XD]|uniref:hypothetical protein n=1 Tax=Clostridium sp. AM58-1XD TaxID=2292307 RepID=UPI0015F78375|nr:hypothetical protein [Clostridium sp. AM58-1XD]
MSNNTEKFKEKICHLMIGAFDLKHYPIQEDLNENTRKSPTPKGYILGRTR